MNHNLQKRIFAIAAVSLMATALAAFGKNIQDRQEYEYQLTGPGNLVVEVYDADIEIIGERDRASASIVVTKTARNMDEKEAEEAFELYTIDCSQEDNLVRIESRRPERSLRDLWNKLSRDMSVQIKVLLPEEVEVLAKTSDGDISLTSVNGESNLKTSDGDVSATHIEGYLSAKSSDGDIHIESVKGNVEVATSDGDLSISGVEGDLDAKTSDGDISISNLTGSLQAKTSDGNITAEMNETPVADCNLRTSDGDVVLKASENVSADLEVRVSDGDIRIDHPSATITQLSKHNIKGRLNQGGKTIQISTADGNIAIEN